MGEKGKISPENRTKKTESAQSHLAGEENTKNAAVVIFLN